MLSVFNLQWLRLKREPMLTLAFFALTIGFVFFLTGSQGASTITVQTFSDVLSEKEMNGWLERLNESEIYKFEIQEREVIEDRLRMNRISFALELGENSYNYLVGSESQFFAAINQHVSQVYHKHLRIEEASEQLSVDTLAVQNYIQSNVRTLNQSASEENKFNYQVIIGMTLYFAMFTILFSLASILTEKRSGTWNRLIISPLKKTEIYVGQLFHYFLLGMLQILFCFVMFKFLFGYDFGSQYLALAVVSMAYVFAIVALGMLITGLVRSPQQLQSVIPVVTTAMAMLGGAFWPLELVKNSILLGLSKVTPIHYGLEGLTKTIVYNNNLLDVIQPVSILLLMGVIFMGVGINLMERVK